MSDPDFLNHYELVDADGNTIGYSCRVLGCTCAHISRSAAYKCMYTKFTKRVREKRKPTPRILDIEHCVTTLIDGRTCITHVPFMCDEHTIYKGRWKAHAHSFDVQFDGWLSHDVMPSPAETKRLPRWRLHFVGAHPPIELPTAPDARGWAYVSTLELATSEALWWTFGPNVAPPPPPVSFPTWGAYVARREGEWREGVRAKEQAALRRGKPAPPEARAPVFAFGSVPEQIRLPHRFNGVWFGPWGTRRSPPNPLGMLHFTGARVYSTPAMHEYIFTETMHACAARTRSPGHARVSFFGMKLN